MHSDQFSLNTHAIAISQVYVSLPPFEGKGGTLHHLWNTRSYHGCENSTQHHSINQQIYA